MQSCNANTPAVQARELFSKGCALLKTGDPSAALNYFLRIQDLAAPNPAVFLYAGSALHDLRRYDEAVSAYRSALQLDSNMGEAHNNLGNSLMALGRFAEATESFETAARLLPSSPVPLTTLATAQQATGKIIEAEMSCREALALNPDFAEAHWNLALNLLLQGRYSEGWQEYEWRWLKTGFTSPRLHTDIPQWDGTPLHGRTILLHAEQGRTACIATGWDGHTGMPSAAGFAFSGNRWSGAGYPLRCRTVRRRLSGATTVVTSHL